MALYRHYKGKKYWLRGETRHSETLEELVLYDCLYENELGRSWVRPKAMFFSEVRVEGVSRPRFSLVETHVQKFEGMDPPLLERLGLLLEACFGVFEREKFEQRLSLEGSRGLLAQILVEDGEDVAFKVGYEKSATLFYSWLGGVIPAARHRGYATKLMHFQHQEARQKGYQRIQTKSYSDNRDMLRLNLKHGFEVIEIEPLEEGRRKLVLERSL